MVPRRPSRTTILTFCALPFSFVYRDATKPRARVETTGVRHEVFPDAALRKSADTSIRVWVVCFHRHSPSHGSFCVSRSLQIPQGILFEVRDKDIEAQERTALIFWW